MNYNLLPWREAQAARSRWYRHLVCWLGVAGLSLGVGWAGCVLHEKVAVLQEQSNVIANQIERVRQQTLKRDSVTAPPSVHESAGLYLLLRSLFSALNDGVCFTALHVQRAGVLFHGRVNNDIALSHFLMAWPLSLEFSAVRLQSLNHAPEINSQLFELLGSLVNQRTRLNNDD